MPLSRGTQLGPYEILAPIGAGGMGEVYRARDTRLGRAVAIKIANERFSDRFEREARAVAALNHPNICTLYDVGPNYLVMELIEGPTLAERIKQGALPVDEALPIAGQIAEALEAAHEQRVVHCDLKPANVKITPESKVKVLDFGLAKIAVQTLVTEPANPADASTITTPGSSAGAIIGTPAYMPPEQAQGRPVDKRGDIWSFGVVLYEMLSGRQMFEGKTTADTLAAVLRADLDWSGLPANTPPEIRRLLRRCLERDPKQRLRDVGEARIAINQPEELLTIAGKARRDLRWLPWTAALLFAGLGAWGWLHTAPSKPAPVTRWTIPVADLRPVASWVALSRDGTRLAYVEGAGGATHIALQMMDQFAAKPIPGTEGGLAPAFSPDGQWIVYQADSKVGKIPVTGGKPVILSDGAPQLGASWGDDDTILVGGAPGGGLGRVPAAGGPLQTLTTPDPKKGEKFHMRPEWLPGGRAALFTIAPGRIDQPARIAVLDLKKGGYRVLVDRGSSARYVPTGHLVYERGGTLFAAAFNIEGLAVTGAEVPVVQGVATQPGISLADFAFANSGLLVYRPAGAQTRLLQWMDRKGATRAANAPPQNYSALRLSPDGERVAVQISGADSTGSDIWICDLARGSLARLTFDGLNSAPIWTPDGRRITFAHQEKADLGVYGVPADGSGKPELLMGVVGIPTSWSPDGKTLLYDHFGSDNKPSIWMRPAPVNGVEGKPQPFLEAPYEQRSAEISPDGQWVVYVSNESGSPEVYVQPFPIQGALHGGKTPISTHGGFEPRWSRTGHEVFFRTSSGIVAVAVQGAQTFRAIQSQVLFPYSNSYGYSWDAAPDGRGFLAIKYANTAGGRLQAVVNWFEELRLSGLPARK